MRPEIREIAAAMEAEGYVADASIATAVHLATSMRRPLLVEGDAGVGKTEIAKVLARILDTELIRLQCYEGLDVHTALYEWDYQRQLLRLRIEEGGGRPAEALEDAIFSREYLLERPLLRAITRTEGPPVLLIDEIDRADDAFEAFLLEVLSDFQVSIPEIGTIAADHVPHVVLTSNRTRELGDALRRRCLYLWIDQPDLEKELAIVRARVPAAAEGLAGEVGRFMQAVRRRSLYKMPGVAETLDWARALTTLGVESLDAATVEETLGCIVKDHHDARELTSEDVAALVEEARGGS